MSDCINKPLEESRMNKSKGFTLIEMMIVLAIVAILLSIVMSHLQGASVQEGAAQPPAKVKVF